MKKSLYKNSKVQLFKKNSYSKNKIFFLGVVFLSLLLHNQKTWAQNKSFIAPLTDATNIQIEGPHRFITINGLKGFHPTSIKTLASFETDIHKSDKGSVSFWFSPLEDLSTSNTYNTMKKRDKSAFVLPLISDANPPRDIYAMNFGVHWGPAYPSLAAQFKPGFLWNLMDYGRAPFAWAESLRIRKGEWYFVTVNWDRTEKQLWMYVNGKLFGHNLDQVGELSKPNSKLYIGNPSMVIRDLILTNAMETPENIEKNYAKGKPDNNALADKDVKKYTELANLPPLDIVRDASWKETFATTFTKKKDLDGWVFQTGDKFRDEFVVEITDEGLLIEAPEKIDAESRMYLWSPESYEGDQWIEFEFRPESLQGLALGVFCTSGSQREDFIKDHELEKTGFMDLILLKTRNYHWEFFRRVYMDHQKVETQYLLKNPWAYTMSYSCIPRLEQNKWYKLEFIKQGNRISGAINGITVFDVMDDAGLGQGPVMNFGRFGFRHMFRAKVRYKNFKVYTKNGYTE